MKIFMTETSIAESCEEAEKDKACGAAEMDNRQL